MILAIAVGVIGAFALAVSPIAGQGGPGGGVARIAGKPNMTGLWQALTGANWNIQDHGAAPGPFYQLGAIGAIPPSQGIVDGNEIPYLPAAAAKKRENQLELADAGSGSQVLHAGHPPRDVHAVSVPDRAGPTSTS